LIKAFANCQWQFALRSAGGAGCGAPDGPSRIELELAVVFDEAFANCQWQFAPRSVAEQGAEPDMTR